jgi:hypothetical protein
MMEARAGSKTTPNEEGLLRLSTMGSASPKPNNAPRPLHLLEFTDSPRILHDTNQRDDATANIATMGKISDPFDLSYSMNARIGIQTTEQAVETLVL